MDFLLNQSNGFKIEIFSKYHFLLILLTLLFVLWVIVSKEKFINMNTKVKKSIKLTLAIILIVNWIIRRGSFIYYGVYNWHNHLDINFCNFTSIMFLIYCLTGNKKLYTICYYMAFIGPLIAILIPSVTLKPLNYSFYSFIILHHLVFIFNFMFLYMENYKYRKEDLKNTSIFLIVYFLGIYIFNIFTGTKYNMPMGFVNNQIENTVFIKFLSFSNLTLFFSLIFVVIFLMLVAKKILKILNNND